MYINAIEHYIPEVILDNIYFSEKNKMPADWIYSRTGIKERRKTKPDENTNTMAIEAVERMFLKFPEARAGIDLIIGASYTPYDTVATVGHIVQRHFNISNTKTFYISSACSSVINGCEIADSFFATKKANKALIVASENNSLYYNENDEASGHLWGDGAAAMIISNTKKSEKDFEIIDVVTHGLANEGKGPYGVYLRVKNGGLKMPHGRDVYANACTYMVDVTMEILKRNNLNIADVNYLIPHQANMRIIESVTEKLGMKEAQIIVNIDKLGNTGCASSIIGLSQHYSNFPEGSVIVIPVFGGGYSSGALLIRT
jgi:3-oxoacyl-[acyl-carrier-protein] synthase III